MSVPLLPVLSTLVQMWHFGRTIARELSSRRLHTTIVHKLMEWMFSVPAQGQVPLLSVLCMQVRVLLLPVPSPRVLGPCMQVPLPPVLFVLLWPCPQIPFRCYFNRVFAYFGVEVVATLGIVDGTLLPGCLIVVVTGFLIGIVVYIGPVFFAGLTPFVIPGTGVTGFCIGLLTFDIGLMDIGKVLYLPVGFGVTGLPIDGFCFTGDIATGAGLAVGTFNGIAGVIVFFVADGLDGILTMLNHSFSKLKNTLYRCLFYFQLFHSTFKIYMFLF